MQGRLQRLQPYLLSGICCLLLLLTSCQGISRSGRISGLPASHPSQEGRRSGIYHEVKPGQTLWSIARAYRIEVPALARANQLSDASTVHTGQRLYIPGATQLREADSRCPCGPEFSPTVPKSAPAPAARSSERSLATRFITPQNAYVKDILPEHVLLVWPVEGEVSRPFEQDATRRHDGIDIAAPQGFPIHAAADGEVMFSGWGPGGYGQTIILQHQADIVTIYAHNNENLAKVGQKVRKGELIARVGQSGRATGNHLHFEVRHKAVPISPYKFLPHRPSHIAALGRG